MKPNLESLMDMARILASDAESAQQRIDTGKSQNARRDFVRALFANFEGMCYLMRQFALNSLLEKPLTPDDIPKVTALAEASVVIKEDGKVRPTDLRTPLRNILAFSFRTFSENWGGVSVTLDKSGTGYRAFDLSIPVRDRITHPKAAADMEISDTELETLKAADQWFLENLDAILKAAENASPKN